MELIRAVHFGLVSLVTAALLSIHVSARAEEYPIGAILPLTGDSAFWGENCRKGIDLALQDLAPSRDAPRLKLIYEDDKCDPKQAVAAFQKLVEIDRVKIIVGPACSSAAAAIAPLAERKQIFLAFFAEAKSVPIGPGSVRLWVPNDHQGRKLAEAVRALAIERVGLIAAENAYAVDLAAAFKQRFLELGGRIAADASYAPEASDLRPQLLTIRRSSPGALVFAGYIKDGALLVNQARQLSLKIPLFGPSTLDSPDFVAAVRERAEGIYIVEVPDRTSAAFKQRWQQSFKVPWPGLASGGSIFYDFIKLLAAKLSHGKAAASELKNYLLALPPQAGVSGPFAFDREGNLQLEHRLLQFRGGKLSEVSLPN